MKKSILFFAGILFFVLNNRAQTMSDYDGNIYPTVTIGTQTWMAENLHVKHYNDGSPIPLVTNTTTWSNLTTGARCYYNNDSLNNAAPFGCLYNWMVVVDPRRIAPAGWHVPSDADYQLLISYMGGQSVGGGPLKDTGYVRWNNPNSGATNATGFTGVGGGNRGNTGSFFSQRAFGDYWDTTASTSTARGIVLYYNNTTIGNGWTDKKFGFSVRLVSDSLISTSVPGNPNPEKINIYPNPARDIIHISCAKTQNQFLRIYNLLGECVFRQVLDTENNEVDISSLSGGVYIIQLSGADKTIQQKLIKE